jgi:hypothetical protein
MKWTHAIIIASFVALTQELSDYKDKRRQHQPLAVQQMQQSEAIHFRKIGQVIGDVHFGHLKI